MGKLRVECFSISLDGFGAGPDQTAEAPMGQGGMALHQWAFATQAFGEMTGHPASGAGTGVDDRAMRHGFEGIGSWVLGRNMFGPVRGPWPDKSWRGWWGDEPPYHCEVFVLTHHARPSLEMKGGTVFHFVTDGLASAVDRAKASAGNKDVRLGGGVATLREGFRLGLIDSANLVLSPVVLGRGEALFAGLDLPALGYRVAGLRPGENASHVAVERA